MKYIFLKTRLSLKNKLVLSLLLIFLFSLIYYLFCNDDEFSGIIELVDKRNKIKYLDTIFERYSKDKIHIYRDEFSKIPIRSYNGSIIIDIDDKPDINLNKKIFDSFDTKRDGKISRVLFENLPILYNPEYSDRHQIHGETYRGKLFSEFERWFYYLYYSGVTQSSLGYGDIIPITLKTRFIALTQIILSLVVIFY